MSSLDLVEQLSYMPFDPIVKRTEGKVKENNKIFKTTKGAPHVILKLIVASMKDDSESQKEKITASVEEDVHRLGLRGIRSLAVAKSQDPEGEVWEFLGLLTFLDPPRYDINSYMYIIHTRYNPNITIHFLGRIPNTLLNKLTDMEWPLK